jgi:hypothetical protein
MPSFIKKKITFFPPLFDPTNAVQDSLDKKMEEGAIFDKVASFFAFFVQRTQHSTKGGGGD